MTIDTSGIQTTANCSNPSEPPILTPIGTTSFNLSSKSVDGCVHSVLFDSTVRSILSRPRSNGRSCFQVATEQYGVDDVVCLGNASTLNSSLRPVMFWWAVFLLSIKICLSQSPKVFPHPRRQHTTSESYLLCAKYPSF